MSRRSYFTFIHVFILIFLQTNLVLGFNLSLGKNNIKCIEIERQALLSFKHGLLDTYNILSSWRSDKDCCNWRGVQCSNNTGHIISLNLRGSNSYFLKGKVGSSLVNLSHLNYLDLSHNVFNNSPIPSDIGCLVNLNYLNLSFSGFGGVIPLHLGNLSKLSVLDVGHNFQLLENDNDFRWLSNLSSLKYLDLSHIHLNSTNDWPSAINKLALLESLALRYCALPNPKLSSYSYTNFSKFLSLLDLCGNNLNSSLYPWLFNFANSLIYLDLGSNYLQGLIPNDFKNMTSLMYLDLSFNNLQGVILDDFANMTSLTYLNLGHNNMVGGKSSKPFENLCSLRFLFLSYNNVGGLLSNFIKSFPQCLLNSLQYLRLASNNFSKSSLPDFTIFPSLKGLDLSQNKFSGTIPQSFGKLSNLEHLDLSGNSLDGEVFEDHFSKLTKLLDLNLSGNSLTFNVSSDWIPPFQLDFIFLRSCKLGPLFPKWLRTQKFTFLDISHAEISDTIPDWFWNNLSPNIGVMDLSRNKIKGEIPNLPIKLESVISIDLNSNELEGPIPAFLLQAAFLTLSNNFFSGVNFLCEIANISRLLLLAISNNQLSGQLPDCWDKVPYLSFLSLADNKFSGGIPRSMGNLSRLHYLHLRTNKFSGELSSWLNFTNLIVLDVKENELSGPIPMWIGSQFPNLVRLSLKSNQFHGNLPSSLCNLGRMQLLDISSNNITGSIPTCIGDFNALTQQSTTSKQFEFDDILNFDGDFPGDLSHSIFQFRTTYHEDMVMVWKGIEREIQGKILESEKIIDLSGNHLTGNIPGEITTLIGLITLNLSRNNLTGQIPMKMGELHSLESLDLSMNQIFGQIPSSFSQLYGLSQLDLSHNNLSGKIPTGNQLATFEARSYEGNPYLCGVPLKSCPGEDVDNPHSNSSHIESRSEDGFATRELVIGMSVGFFVGFGGIFGSLVLHRKWRHVYFQLLSDLSDVFYVATRVQINRLRRLFGN